MSGKRQHFVPQHYLRHFRVGDTDQIAIVRLDPFKFAGIGGIKGQCKGDYFYEDQTLDDLITQQEQALGPVLINVIKNETFNSEELVALRFFAVALATRTRKAAEIAKLWPKKVAFDFATNEIATRRIRPPIGGLEKHMIDFRGVPGFIIKSDLLHGWMEMQTLNLKLLKTEAGAFLITSDHPVVMLNEYFAARIPHRSFVGFGRSGFQLLVPISPRLCLFFFDGRVYKVGGRRDDVVKIGKDDVEIVNSLQVQNADKCLYFNDAANAGIVETLVRRYSSFRKPIEDLIRTIPMGNEGEEFLHFRNESAALPRPWQFCRGKRHQKIGPDEMRAPEWSALAQKAIERLERDPKDGNIFRAMWEALDKDFTTSG